MNTAVSANTHPTDGVTAVTYKLQGYLALLNLKSGDGK